MPSNLEVANDLYDAFARTDAQRLLELCTMSSSGTQQGGVTADREPRAAEPIDEIAALAKVKIPEFMKGSYELRKELRKLPELLIGNESVLNLAAGEHSGKRVCSPLQLGGQSSSMGA